ncbi:MAG: hypothetical protein L6Q95_19440 [Planctomycetes bacterium]|nr:hypothetical protein [Planctomycetota bacterium]
MTLIQALDDGGRPLRALHDPRLPVSANATLELDFERPAGPSRSTASTGRRSG